MASYGTNTIQRPSLTTPPPPPSAAQSDELKASTRKNRRNFNLVCPYNLPSTPEAAAVRIIRNLSYFGIYYAIFVWVTLFAVLVPKRKVSLIFLVSMTAVTCLYLLLPRLMPCSVVLHKIIDKRLVLAFLVIVLAVEMVLTRAGVHFFVTLAAAGPVVLLHAVLRVRDDLFVNEEACAAGELVPLVVKKSGGEAQPPASSV